MLLTTNEATKYFRISRPTLIKLARAKKIPAMKLGKQWRFIINKEDIKNAKNTEGNIIHNSNGNSIRS